MRCRISVAAAFRESQHQNSIEGNGRFSWEQTAQASLDQRTSFTCAGARHHQDVARAAIASSWAGVKGMVRESDRAILLRRETR